MNKDEILKSLNDCARSILCYLVIVIKVSFLAFCLYTVALVVVKNHCKANEIGYGEKSLSVFVAYGRSTLFRFNEPVRTISQASKFKIRPADKKKPDYSVLSVTPRFTGGESKVSFILTDGSVVTVTLKILPSHIEGKTSSFYDFEPKENKIKFKKSDHASASPELELMKAMIQSKNLYDYRIRKHFKKIKSGPSRLQATLQKVYIGSQFNGYIFQIKNFRKESYEVDLLRLNFGNPSMIILSQVDKKILKAREKTFLRLVTKAASTKYGLNLPFSLEEGKK